jgi:hypothetical protein
MEIKIITLHDVFIDAVAKDTDLLKWAENWILHNDFDTEFWNGGRINIDNESIHFKGDNGMIELNIITKTI